jgi:hypothetical protein
MLTLYLSLHTEHQCDRTNFPPYSCPGSLSIQLPATIFYQAPSLVSCSCFTQGSSGIVCNPQCSCSHTGSMMSTQMRTMTSIPKEPRYGYQYNLNMG